MRMDPSWRRLILAAPLALALVVGACSDDDKNPVDTGDVTAPAAIANLAKGTVTANSVALTWTAPGDDGGTGTADKYDVRYSLNTITAGNWGTGQQVAGEPDPGAAGSGESYTVTGLTPNTTYYFAVMTADEKPNWSGISNVVQATTLAGAGSDTTAPAAITSLAPGAITASSVVLEWDAPGDDGATGTATQYDIRYSLSTITEGNFAAATPVPGAPAPASAGTSQQVTVSGLAAGTQYFFAMKASDEIPNWSALSNVVTATTSQAADVTPPAAVTDLSGVALAKAGAAIKTSAVELTWTSPGDDGNTGTAASYDVRWSTTPITTTNWGSATQAAGEPLPAAAGTQQMLTVADLQSNTDYYFALKTTDESANVSNLSNVVMVHTLSGDLPPEFLVPDFPDSVCITSTDTYAMIAKSLAEGQLAIVSIYASLASAFFGQLQYAEWQQTGDCWDYIFNYSGTCTGRYQVCKSGFVYTYTLSLDGDCFGTVYDNWVAYRFVADTASREATFYIYGDGTTTIEAAWVWTWAEDNNSGTYTFYSGDPETAPVDASIIWSRSADHNVYDLTYTVPESAKIVSHFVANPCSGWLKSYQWDSTIPDWWLEYDIAWSADGTGYWDTYDITGALVEHHAW